jgi:predicted deacylase
VSDGPFRRDGRVHRRHVEAGSRVDGTPWRITVLEVSDGVSGPTTAVVAGIFGDKPLSSLAAWELVRRLEAQPVRGTVLVVPAANPFALEAGTRAGPDGLWLNRRFPGSPMGFTTDQLAHALLAELASRADCLVDLHSGTPTMAVGYTYAHGDPALAASFGYLPVVVGHQHEGQLTVAAARRGLTTCLPEFGGGPHRATTIGVEGCLNVLRFRGHVSGAMTGPSRLPRVAELALFVASTAGALCGRYGAEDVGRAVDAGVLGEVVNVVTGEPAQEFAVARPGILLLGRTTPTIVQPGDYAFMVGFPEGEIEVPTAGRRG